MGKEEAGSANGHESTLLLRVLLLDIGESLDDLEGLSFALNDSLNITAGDDEDVELFQMFVDLLEGGIGFKDDALLRLDSWSGGCIGAIKCSGAYECQD